MKLGRFERIDAGEPRPPATTARRQMRTLVRSFLPVGRLSAACWPTESTHSALELLAVVLRGSRTTPAALGAAGGLPVT
jgi:hypothetical protein